MDYETTYIVNQDTEEDGDVEEEFTEDEEEADMMDGTSTDEEEF